MLWPNADAGADDIARGIRNWREQGLDSNMHFFKNLPVATYVRLMQRTACLIGNSSSGIREGAFMGMPVVNVGSRQQGRERGENVLDAPHDAHVIAEAVRRQVDHGSFPMQPIYGDGHAGKRIADVLSTADVQIQKRITH